MQQAAAIGGIKAEELINRLRREVGQDLTADSAGTAQPARFDPTRVTAKLDARPMLAAGEQPVNQAMADLSTMAPGSITMLSAPFLPAPLIDKGSSLGLDH